MQDTIKFWMQKKNGQDKENKKKLIENENLPEKERKREKLRKVMYTTH